jgi:hypothetical protein
LPLFTIPSIIVSWQSGHMAWSILDDRCMQKSSLQLHFLQHIPWIDLFKFFC